MKKRYNKKSRKMVVEEALKPEFEDKLYLVADKYVLSQTVIERWVSNYKKLGDVGLTKGFAFNIEGSVIEFKDEEIKQKDKKISELEEEIEIPKKATAFLAKLNRD